MPPPSRTAPAATAFRAHHRAGGLNHLARHAHLASWHAQQGTNDIRTMLAMIYNRSFLNAFISATELIENPRITWEQLSERAKHIFRHNPIVDKAPPFHGKAPPYSTPRERACSGSRRN